MWASSPTDLRLIFGFPEIQDDVGIVPDGLFQQSRTALSPLQTFPLFLPPLFYDDLKY